MRTALIVVAGTDRQNKYFWPSYKQCWPGQYHDLIVVHKDFQYLPSFDGWEEPDKVILENKILPSGELPNKAFGAYKYYFEKYKNDYDVFGFISDDIKLKRQDWLCDATDGFEIYEKLGFVSPLLLNNPRHIRAPIWFARTEALMKTKWQFDNDHDGEMRIADQITEAGYFGMQIGHKIDFAYDPEWESQGMRVCGSPFPLALWEKSLYGTNDKIYTNKDSNELNKYLVMLKEGQIEEEFNSDELKMPLSQQHYNICLEFQPYDKLIYNPSLPIVKECGIPYYSYDKEVKAGVICPPILFGKDNKRYVCKGINKDNAINIIS